SGGIATFYSQNGNAGSCGNYNSDNAMIVAVDSAIMNSALCGKKVQITNKSNGKTATATVADTCPTCNNANSLDMSKALFGALTDNNYGLGIFNIEWHFV
ncbi:barwin-like endoglucanase, partial [Jaminaea rosea]